MERLKLNENSKIYVACPANTATGGPELLHQLVYELTNLGLNAFMFYYNCEKNKKPIHEAYLIYNNKYVTKIDDRKDNILIVPEVKTSLLYKYNLIQKVIWWLSVDNFFNFLNSKNKIERFLKRLLYKMKIYPFNRRYNFNKNDHIIHFVQSEYARQFLMKRNVSNIFYLSDYLNKRFIENQSLFREKRNIVVYNPKKGLDFTKKLIEYAKDIDFVPIENMTRDEVANLLSSAKVYIDFGNHPGKDRLPREAAISGCCVIVGKKGAANYYEDVPIDNEFKFDVTIENIPSIINKIRECLDNYETEIHKFSNYRYFIKNEQNQFYKDLINIFQINEN